MKATMTDGAPYYGAASLYIVVSGCNCSVIARSNNISKVNV